jgi:hypothetical protein
MIFATSVRFGIFSMLYSMLTAYFLQNVITIIEATFTSPIATFLALTGLFAFIYNVIFILAMYDIEDDEDTTKAYIFVLIAFIVAILISISIGSLIKG